MNLSAPGLPIYHLCSRADWENERDESRGVYLGSAAARSDGFLHLSASHQVAESLAKHFAGQTGLVLISVEAAKLGEALKWETSRGGKEFPHLYGPMPFAAVIGVEDISVGPDGGHILPSSFAAAENGPGHD